MPRSLGDTRMKVASFFQSRESAKDPATGKRVYLPVHVDAVVGGRRRLGGDRWCCSAGSDADASAGACATADAGVIR